MFPLEDLVLQTLSRLQPSEDHCGAPCHITHDCTFVCGSNITMLF